MLSSRIKELRQKFNRTQGELAEFIGISQKAVSRWETGLSDPTAENITKIADFFGITVAELYGGAAPAKEEKDEVTKLIDKLISVGIIKDPEDISNEVADMIINAVKIDLQMRKLKQEL